MAATSSWEDMEQRLAPYGPQKPLGDLIEDINLIYHKHEAGQYDRRHPELTTQLPAVWRRLVAAALESGLRHPLRVIDFGCGTGFATEMALAYLPQGSVATVTCYDPSAEMLRVAQARLANWSIPITFTHIAPWDAALGKIDLLITNSVLHHLPNPISVVRRLTPLMSRDAIWILGHEPSRRFFRNPVCAAAYGRYSRYRRWHRYLELGAHVGRVRRRLTRRHPADLTAREAWHVGLFAVEPPSALIGRITDFHVANSADEAEVGRGFDFEQLQRHLARDWRLARVETYSYMGPVYEGQLSTRWRAEASRLAETYPMDGSNFGCVWTRARAGSPLSTPV